MICVWSVCVLLYLLYGCFALWTYEKERERSEDSRRPLFMSSIVVEAVYIDTKCLSVCETR